MINPQLIFKLAPLIPSQNDQTTIIGTRSVFNICDQHPFRFYS